MKHPTEGPRWQLNLFGRFSLADSAGRTVRLPDRKTEGLLAILALNRDYGIPRQDAANILWPGKEPQNLANLRQALAVVRRALGAEAVETSAYHCRLASTFRLETDYESPVVRRAGGFMPGHEGDWFEDIRLEAATVETTGVVDHYYQSLRWLADHDPRSMFAILSASPSMARSLPYPEFGTLLDVAKCANPPRGWYAYWLGTVKSDLTECKGLLRSALKLARADNDLALASEVCLELGRAHSRTSDLSRARKLCDYSDEIAARAGTLDARLNALRLRGTVQFQWHEAEAGDATLRQLEETLDSPIEIAAVAHLRAFFQASAGWHDQAEITYRRALRASRETGHFRIGVLSSMTAAVLEAAGGNRAVALTNLHSLASGFYENDCSQFGVYSEELAAKLHFLERDRSSANRLWRSARDARMRSQMSMTPLEQMRVACIR